jgi:MFS family permease
MGIAYPGKARVRAITVYGMVMGLAAAGGQLIGGLLIAADPFGLGWRTVFLVNVPVGVVALASTSRSVQNPGLRTPAASTSSACS